MNEIFTYYNIGKNGQIDHLIPVQIDHPIPEQIDHLIPVQTDHQKNDYFFHAVSP
jgi:hypothetical protein